MKFLRKAILISFLFVALSYFSQAESGAISLEMKGKKAEITLLDGKAFVKKQGIASDCPLVMGDFLLSGDRITVGKNSRMELRLPDASLVRLDEETIFELVSIDFDASTKSRKIDMRMIMGKTWAKVSKFIGVRQRFSISTKTAVAGVRGTVFRMNVYQDNSALMKVYNGEISVNSGTTSASKIANIAKPFKIAGPSPIAGPHPVSMQEWTYIVKSMRQIFIKSDGSAGKPIQFSARADMNDWVRWNKKLDIIGN